MASGGGGAGAVRGVVVRILPGSRVKEAVRAARIAQLQRVGTGTGMGVGTGMGMGMGLGAGCTNAENGKKQMKEKREPK